MSRPGIGGRKSTVENVTRVDQHSPTGNYKQGELVERNGAMFKANSDIDGRVTPVPFVTGSGVDQWTPINPIPDHIGGNQSDSGATIADADRFVHNDGGTMKQTSFTRVWAWITGKITGAASTILTSNLTAGKVVVSSTGGKISTSSVDASELQVIDGSRSAETASFDDNDKIILNDNGSMKQVRLLNLKQYLLPNLIQTFNQSLASSFGAGAAYTLISDGTTQLRAYKTGAAGDTGWQIQIWRSITGSTVRIGYDLSSGTASTTATMSTGSSSFSIYNINGSTGNIINMNLSWQSDNDKEGVFVTLSVKRHKVSGSYVPIVSGWGMVTGR